MKVSEIRTQWLNYFKKHNHTVVESSSLIPHNDQTLLFTNAGMVQFKDVFTGKEKRNYTKAVTIQKCVRAGGKHNDLENVGFTARHHTFFEMLGNFSFGDYFKKEAIPLAWDFITKELKIPTDALYVSVHLNDDEAADIWEKDVGLPKDRIYRFDEDNFWSMGETGPCGPSSEIFVDRGEKYGCKKSTCKMGCDCDRYMEIWNLVFMQYNRDKEGNMHPLPKPSVDTGAGLERLASVLQEVETNYEIDSFLDIMNKIADLLNKKYVPGKEDSFNFRVIADHFRSVAFLISDGVIPSNEGRGYVLRRIIRRAIRYGKNLGFSGPFLHKTCGFVVDQMQDSYPDLAKQKDFIEKIVISEEEQFFKTLERGLSLLDEEMEKASGELSGEVAFKLYDTYGFPVDLTRIICQEKNISVDESGFEKCMEEQKSRSRQSWKGSSSEETPTHLIELEEKFKNEGITQKFTGYESLLAYGKPIAIFACKDDNVSPVESYTTQDEKDPTILQVVFETTPFYAESGGQVADKGSVYNEDYRGIVIDVQKPIGNITFVHLKSKSGTISIDKSYHQEVNESSRLLTRRNHTATHILQWALRETLGSHVKQSGSMVSPDLMRFDFNHFSALTPEQIKEVETKVNEKIWSPSAVKSTLMEKDEAVAAGAIAFFGDKYGDTVRVIDIGGFSTELCGGIHAKNTTEIGLFKIISESSIASGVRRITAYSSKKAFQYLQEREEEARYVRDRLKSKGVSDIENKLDKMAAVEKSLRKELEQQKGQEILREVDELVKASIKINDTHLIQTLCIPDSSGAKKLRDLSDRLREKEPNSIVILGMNSSDNKKANLLIAVGNKAPNTIKANQLIKELAPLINGRGGGKPDVAQAGGTDTSGMEKVFQQSQVLLKESL